MSLKVKAYSGSMGAVSNTGCQATNAACFIAALRAMYGDQFGWPQIEEFKSLNDIEDWEPRDDLKADGYLISGNILTPDGFDLSGWQDYYSDWRAGKVIATLPPVDEAEYEVIEDDIEFVPENLGWNPSAQPIATATPSATPSAAATVASTTQVATAAQAAPIAANKKKADSGVPGWVWVAGGVGGLALLSMVFGKKGRR